MLISKRDILISSSLAVLIAGIAVPAGAQTASRDGIGDLIRRGGEAVGVFTSVAEARDGEKGDDGKAAAATDPRAGDPAFDQARRLMAAIDAVLRDTAEQRSAAGKLPARDDFLVPPIWTETREDREAKIRNLHLANTHR